MTLQEKLDRETGNHIYLYKQGVFWVAYEQSALLLIMVKELKPTIRFYKTVNREVLSVGFPETTKGFFADRFGTFTETGRHMGYFNIGDEYEKTNLQVQRKQIVKEHAGRCSADNKRQPGSIAEAILSFNLAEKTPIEAMLFVRELQEKIRQNKGE